MADLLEISGVYGGYGEADILHGTRLSLARNEIAVIIGPNGAGKSTLMKSVFGLVHVRRGEIRFQGADITNRQTSRIARLGLGYVPQENNVFPSMTIRENLDMGAFLLDGDAKAGRRRIYELFPRLAECRDQIAGTLSGGERQMLAMGRALMTEPRLLMLDEPTAALAPRYVADTFQCIRTIRDLGIAILLVEQNARQALRIADRGIVLVMGENRFEDRADALLENREVAEMYLGGQA